MIDTKIITETIEIDNNGEYVIEADQKIVDEMKRRLAEGKKLEAVIVDMTTEQALNSKGELMLRVGGYEITKHFIALNHTQAKITYFLDTVEGCSCDSYNTLEEAVKNLNELTD